MCKQFFNKNNKYIQKKIPRKNGTKRFLIEKVFDFGQMIEQNVSGAIKGAFRSWNGRKIGKSISI